jgi:N-acetylmuramoyl-L-alanine amidase
MPSVLIEVGYISHPSEGKRVNTSKYQKLISQAIANGINSYFAKN